MTGAFRPCRRLAVTGQARRGGRDELGDLAPRAGAVNDGVWLSWLPLGAGGRFVAWNGRAYERWVARRQGRRPQPLFHAALEVVVDAERYVVEMAPVWNLRVPDRGAVVEGPVGSSLLSRSRAFRYEVRRWRDGVIPDADWAVGCPVLLSTAPGVAARLLDLVPRVPALTWGRDELGVGDMWNSNSLVAWLLASSGVAGVASLAPPGGGRAPGWQAGLALAAALRSADGRDSLLDVHRDRRGGHALLRRDLP